MSAPHVRVAIVGTGFSGVGTAIALRRAGIDDFVLFERAGDVGGTWRDNAYPGCQCDVPSHLYSFSFAPNPEWSRTYSMRGEIWGYLRACAERFGVVPHVRFGHEVLSAAWGDVEQHWRIETSRGPWTAAVLVAGNGALAEPAIPQIDGLDRFEGRVFHSARWDEGFDPGGARVAVVGTGASAIQIVPQLQRRAARLYVYQRTPAWILPHTDRAVTALERRLYRAAPVAQRAVRGAIYGSRELLVPGLTRNPRLLAPLRALAVAHLRRQVRDPDLRAKLLPRYSPGCKRLLLSNDFYPALCRANVELVTSPVRALSETSVVTAGGGEHAVDAVVLATGFRVTSNPFAERVRGRDGRSLAQAWRDDGLRAYLGTTVDGFPNLFLMTGPNTGIGHTSLLVMIEAQVGYVVECLRTMDERGLGAVEVRRDAVEGFDRAVQHKMTRTVWTTGGCASWYLDATGRNSTLWPDFTWRFCRMTRRFDLAAYHATPVRAPARA
ncbi:MAG TPA: NAD(P)/FAD-dependent oxidoreductase [Actinomycetota bacterium]|nr:NAD(P)/FAD-dependent oxidoreductase [Actinomycetota bacterium]